MAGTVTTESVIDAVKQYVEHSGKQQFTTAEIANYLKADEYTVRAAVGWLRHYRMIEAVPGVRSRRYTKTGGEAYYAVVYRICERGSAPDINMLNAVFCCRCK